MTADPAALARDWRFARATDRTLDAIAAGDRMAQYLTQFSNTLLTLDPTDAQIRALLHTHGTSIYGPHSILPPYSLSIPAARRLMIDLQAPLLVELTSLKLPK